MTQHGYGIERPSAHIHREHRPKARYLVLIESAGPVIALLFTEARELSADFDAGAEEVALMTRGLRAAGCGGVRVGLGGHSREERAAAQVFVLDGRVARRGGRYAVGAPTDPPPARRAIHCPR